MPFFSKEFLNQVLAKSLETNMRLSRQVFIKLILLLGLLCLISDAKSITTHQLGSRPIIDSQFSLAESLNGQDIPYDIKEQLCIVNVHYYSFDGNLHQGQLVINKALKDDIINIFREIEKSKFPIAKAIPISKYNFSDELSMLDNNTSAFNYRLIRGTEKISKHALGRAIDINPFLNPSIGKGRIEPEGSKYNSKVPGTILRMGIVVKAFKNRGWKWGGDWKSLKDYQHFEK